MSEEHVANDSPEHDSDGLISPPQGQNVSARTQNQVMAASFERHLAEILPLLRNRAIRWEKKHLDSFNRLEEALFQLAGIILLRFKMPADREFRRDAVQTWWTLYLPPCPVPQEPYTWIQLAGFLMMLACSRISGRKHWRRREPLDIENLATKASEKSTPITSLQSAEEIALEFDRLKAALREPAIYVYFQNLTVAETAKQMGLTPNAVSGRLFRARRQLRPRLARFSRQPRKPGNQD